MGGIIGRKDGGTVSFFTPAAKFTASLSVLLAACSFHPIATNLESSFPCGLWVVYTESDKGRRRSRRPSPVAYAYFNAVALRRGRLHLAARSNFPSLPHSSDSLITIISLTSLSSYKLTHLPISTNRTSPSTTRDTMTAINEFSGHIWNPLLLFLTALFIYLGSLSYRSWNRLRHIPGPPGAALSKWWMLRNTLGGQMHLALKRACDDYGPVVRIGPNDLVTNDSEILRRMWAVRSPYRKGAFYEAVRFDPTRDNLISMRDDHEHNELRAKMAIGYSGKENEGLESAIDGQIQAFIRLIEERYVSTTGAFRPMDLCQKVQYLTLDIITSLAFGYHFGYVEQDADVHQYIQMTEQSMPAMMTLSVFPQLAKLLQSPLFRQAMPSEHDRVGFGKFIAVAKKVVAERLMSDKTAKRRDMLGSFLAHGLTREEAEGETLVQIIAGSDTTATAIRTTMLYLMTSPSCYSKLAKEVREAANAGVISSPVTNREAGGLQYLQAVIKEGLRVFPPVTGLMSTTVPAGGDFMHGMSIPEGTDIGWTAFGVLRSKAVYGPDADVFRPERWLEAGEDELKAMTAQWELVFKYGKWQCLGKTVALMELNKVFVELLRRFDFALVDPAKSWSSFSAGIFIQSDLWVRVQKLG
ncbi:cytochrome P450 [Colletotrichum phormii]|uniref:Cytochrome P450 n=1 Tax=Colletotrichum phormii TaxID=359342 RepID=A0AAJ0EE04_9PEZI|nr:cytochrome P450 [Colletotrichum phormii]KAK1635288.1 cytochrome P450 [Colletotrichum phormii]